MELNTVWFILVSILFVGFFFLEGFDYGVGILLPFLGKDDTDRRLILNAIGPFWDGNEVWMIAAGGAMFAAFPNWYATLFSGFYLPLLLILLALIVRAVALNTAAKTAVHPGVPCGTGSFSSEPGAGPAVGRRLCQPDPRCPDRRTDGLHRRLLEPAQPLCPVRRAGHPVALHPSRGGLPEPQTKGELMNRAHAMAGRLWPPVAVLVLLFVVIGYLATDMLSHRGASLSSFRCWPPPPCWPPAGSSATASTAGPLS